MPSRTLSHPAHARVRRAAAALVAAAAAAALAGPAAADAATVTFGPSGVLDRAELNYDAKPGENNQVIVSEFVASDGLVDLVLQDSVPIVLAGTGASRDCIHASQGFEHMVRCSPRSFTAKRWQQLNVRLGDGTNFLRSTSGSADMLATGQGATSNDFGGGPGTDRLFGTDGTDRLFGGSGDDTVAGFAGNDRLEGGPGNDLHVGGSGDDLLIGGTGADGFQGQAGSDFVSYGERTKPVKVAIDGLANDGETGEGDNVQLDVENVFGGQGSDEISDAIGTDNRFSGVGGDDRLIGGGGDDTLFGQAGSDGLVGGSGADTLVGDPGFDLLEGGPDNDSLHGGDDGDSMNGGTGRDAISGGSGRDLVSYSDRTEPVAVDLDGAIGDDGAAGEGDSILADVEDLIGGAGSDTLTGNAGPNRIVGRGGNDVIEGGLGTDDLFGESGNDTVDSKDGELDSVNCGADSDQVRADQTDSQTGCEAKAAPAVGIGPDRVRLDDRGRVKLTLHCWATAAERCTGTLKLKHGDAGKTRTIASRDFTVASGDTATIRVRLARSARRAIAKKRLRVRAITRSRDGAGRKWTSKRTVTLVR